MELNNEHCCTTRATKSDLAVAISDPEHAMHLTPPNVSEKSRSYETSLTEPAVTVGKEAAQSFMERVLAVHTVTCAADHLAGLVIESDYDTERKPEPPLKTVARLSRNKRC